MIGKTRKILILERSHDIVNSIRHTLLRLWGHGAVDFYHAETLDAAHAYGQTPDLDAVVISTSMSIDNRDVQLSVIVFAKWLRQRFPKMLIISASGDEVFRHRLAQEASATEVPNKDKIARTLFAALSP